MGNLEVVLLIVGLSCVLVHSQEMFKASQCFKSRGIPKVAFDCPAGHMIKIHRAFHGISNNRTEQEMANQCPAYSADVPGSSKCTQCSGDCIDDSMNLVYDWSTCMGNTTCVRTVMQSYMPSCPGRDKFSDYLQVEYQCVPRDDVIDICSQVEKTLEEGYLFSPNYPNNYPTNEDCLCRIYTEWNSKIHISLYDLLLETKEGRCRADWLMLRQKDQKHRHCGAIMTGTKNITSDSNSLEIQFHTDDNDNRTQNFQYFTRSLKGFWLYFTAQPRTALKVACRRLTIADQEVKEIMSDDEEFEEVIAKDELSTISPMDEGKMSDDMGDEKMDGKGAKRRPPNKGKGRPNSYREGTQEELQEDMNGVAMSSFSVLLLTVTMFLSSAVIH